MKKLEERLVKEKNSLMSSIPFSFQFYANIVWGDSYSFFNNYSKKNNLRAMRYANNQLKKYINSIK